MQGRYPPDDGGARADWHWHQRAFRESRRLRHLD
jgi:hypothetical protein